MCEAPATCQAGACATETVDAGTQTDGGTFEPTDAGTGHPKGPLGELTLADGFSVVGWQPLDPRISRVAGLQNDLPNENPKLYGLVPAFREIRALGTFENYAVGAKMSDAAPAADLALADFSQSQFLANRETVMVSYVHQGSPKASVFSETRKWGVRDFTLFGDFRVAPIGDFFTFSSNGFDALSGSGIYVLLGGPAVNNVRRVATQLGAKPGNVSWAIRDLNILGVHDGDVEKLYACDWNRMVNAFQGAAAFGVETTCLKIHEDSGIVEMHPLASGVVLHVPTTEAESGKYVGLSAEGPYDALVVSATAAVDFVAGPLPGTRIEFMTPYATDVLLGVSDSYGRRLVRVKKN